MKYEHYLNNLKRNKVHFLNIIRTKKLTISEITSNTCDHSGTKFN